MFGATHLRPHALASGQAASGAARMVKYCMRLNVIFGALLAKNVCVSAAHGDIHLRVDADKGPIVRFYPNGVFGNMARPAKPQPETPFFAPLIGNIYPQKQKTRSTRPRPEVALAQFCGTKKPWVLIKIIQPGHITVALINRKSKTIEWFDPSGQYKRDPRTQETEYSMWVYNLELLFDNMLPGYKFIVVNKAQTHQSHEFDLYCQTWIYWYVFMRLVAGHNRRQIMQALQQDTPAQRVERIRNFAEFALTL